MFQGCVAGKGSHLSQCRIACPPTQPGFVSLRGINKDGRRLSEGGREEDEDGSGGVSLDEKRRQGNRIRKYEKMYQYIFLCFWLAFEKVLQDIAPYFSVVSHRCRST
jgi:hypothetical protein